MGKLHMEKKRSSIFYSGVLFFGLCIAFVIMAGCTSISHSVENQNTVLDSISPQVTPTSYLIQSRDQEIEDEKANSISQAIDYRNPITRDFAVGLVKNTNGGSYDKIGVNQICDIWDATKPPHWTYVNDPAGPDYYSPASGTINLGLKGDCDDFAILTAAVSESIGGRSKIITACDSESSCHAYAVVYINNNETDLQSTTNYIGSRYGVKTVYYLRSYSPISGESYWLNLDWWANNPGGTYFNGYGEMHFFYPDGNHYVSTGLSDVFISQTATPTLVGYQQTLVEPQRCPVSGCKSDGPLVAPQRGIVAPTPTIDWSKALVTPTPTINYDWSFKLTT